MIIAPNAKKVTDILLWVRKRDEDGKPMDEGEFVDVNAVFTMTRVQGTEQFTDETYWEREADTNEQ
jgi:hypothetical protein